MTEQNLDLTPEQAIEATLGQREQPPYDELIEALRRDWDIEASWDGLRRFWYVGLTDEGVRKRDEREATLGRGLNDYLAGYQSARSELREENAKLRELMLDMLGYYAMPNTIDYKREAALLERAHELGVEVNDA